MERIYLSILKRHLQKHRQMLFLAGPRQVGKTTIGLKLLKTLYGEDATSHYYLNWDNLDDRKIIMLGPEKVANHLKLYIPIKNKVLVIFDELHKYSKWKDFLKGFFDSYESRIHIIVTGSAKLDMFHKAGDSLMGRYFAYRIHPLSIAEYLNPKKDVITLLTPAQKVSGAALQQLLAFGGFPEPLLKADESFSRQWQGTRRQQLFYGDIQQLTHIQEIQQMEAFAHILHEQASLQINYSNFAQKLMISVSTVKRWLDTLENFYYGFRLYPWSGTIMRSIIKEPKFYLWDWSLISDKGQQYENFVANHLLKAIHLWNDCGLGDFGLFYLRNKEQLEVDFLVTKNNKPWFLVEVKSSSNQGLSKALSVFQKQCQAPHAFQLAFDLDENLDFFAYKEPIIVSASAFLSQLV